MLPRIMCAPIFSMDACEEAIEVHEGIIFGISHIPADTPCGGGGKALVTFIIQT
jgi:hypothetical protein